MFEFFCSIIFLQEYQFCTFGCLFLVFCVIFSPVSLYFHSFYVLCICFWRLPFVFLNSFNVYILLFAVKNIDFIWKMVVLKFSISFLKLVISLILFCYLWSSSISFFSCVSFLNVLLRIHILFRFFKSIIWFKFASVCWEQFFPEM